MTKPKEKSFDEYWVSLTDEQREEIKDLVIERIKNMPKKYKLCVG